MADKKPLRIVLTGGGSGGHITPILAVAHELRQLRPEAELIYIGQRGDSLADIPAADPNIDKIFAVRAGKFRRYHGEGLRQLLDVPTVLKNLRDAWFVLMGLFQSWRLMRRLRPAIVFTRGGFVSVPVALGAEMCGIPYITHDSDAVPSLANRLIAKWARLHAVALPKEVYAYPADKTVTVGVPISRKYVPLTTPERAKKMASLGLGAYKKVVLLTGGGNGAESLNDALAATAPELLKRYPDLVIIQLAGRSLAPALTRKYDDLLSADDRPRVVVKDFVTNLYDYSGVADIVITRAGGTSIAEFAAQGKACIVVPNPLLTGGHQTKNAKVLEERNAAVFVQESSLKTGSSALLTPLCDLLDQPEKTQKLGETLATFAQPDAARKLAEVLLEQIK
jgi:UDP-N-acetylglucosamine--N-acetylmuramyl-(pentapeptide) pyrophosphoryl-undecaprenol N-acetylglucosamine transferase